MTQVSQIVHHPLGAAGRGHGYGLPWAATAGWLTCDDCDVYGAFLELQASEHPMTLF